MPVSSDGFQEDEQSFSVETAKLKSALKSKHSTVTSSFSDEERKE